MQYFAINNSKRVNKPQDSFPSSGHAGEVERTMLSQAGGGHGLRQFSALMEMSDAHLARAVAEWQHFWFGKQSMKRQNCS